MINKMKKLSREEKTKKTYEALMTAASVVVGERGYAGTSIAKVTETAGVSQGTFYNYFEDRQSLFDKLLPYVGERMLAEIGKIVPKDVTGADREIERFRAYCDYLLQNPAFYRILYEAESFAAKAHAEHIEVIYQGYRRSLKRSMDAGAIEAMPDEELEAVIFALLGARAYIAMRYGRGQEIPASAIDGYARLVRQGLFEKSTNT